MAALARKPTDRVPWIEAGVDAPIPQLLLGKTDFQPEELSAFMGLDNLVVKIMPPVFGEYEDREGINFVAHPRIRTRADLDFIEFPDPDDPQLYAQGAEIVRRNCNRAGGNRYAVGASLRLGASPLLMSFGLENFSYCLADDPELVDTILGRYADWTIAVVRHLRDVGFDFVWTFDDMAYKTGPMFSPRILRSVFMPHLRRVAQAIKGEGFPWIFHSDGDLMLLLDDLLTLGMDGLHPLEPGPMDIGLVKARYGDRLCLIGNIDLHYTLTMGTPEEVEAEVKRRIVTIGRGGGYMISSANTITSYCKIENVRAMIDAVRKYREYHAVGV